MNTERLSRLELLIGKDGIEKLAYSRVIIFGIGGVGGYVMEGLARSGIGTIDIVDHDTVALSNINRQIIATDLNVGRLKVDVGEERIHSINPDIIVHKHACFYLPENKNQFDFSQYDYVIDAVDTVTAKITIIEEAIQNHVPVISCMGCGNRMDPEKLKIMDIYETKNDPLARVMRYELRKRNIKKLKTVCSTEIPMQILHEKEESQSTDSSFHKVIPGSSAFVPSAAGLLAASAVVRDILQ